MPSSWIPWILGYQSTVSFIAPRVIFNHQCCLCLLLILHTCTLRPSLVYIMEPVRGVFTILMLQFELFGIWITAARGIFSNLQRRPPVALQQLQQRHEHNLIFLAPTESFELASSQHSHSGTVPKRCLISTFYHVSPLIQISIS